MNGTTRLRIGDINKNLICTLCGGYLIDATTIIECLHSFCRTCIVTYLKTSKTCPVCDTIVHKTRPHQNIRSDKLLQDLVYKLVPGLYKDEMRRRREFYTCHYEAAPKRPGEERGDEMSDRFAYTEEEKISLALYFCQDGGDERMDFRRRVFPSKEDLKSRTEKKIKNSLDVRYLQCKAAVTVGHLKKFVRLKYGLPSHFQVDIYCNDEPLRNSCTLCDVVYICNWRRRAPLLLTFCVYELPQKPGAAPEDVKPLHSTDFKEEQKPVIIASTRIPTAVTTTVSHLKPPSVVVVTTASIATTTTAAAATVLTPAVQPAKAKSHNPTGAQTPKESKLLKSKQQKPRSTPKSSKSKSSTASAVPSPSKSGLTESPATSKTSILGKRPANTPVPIAPAPAKIPAMNSSLVDLARFIKLDPNRQVTAVDAAQNPKLVSLFPAGVSASSPPKPSPGQVSNQKTSNITFSVSSILNAVTNKQSLAQKPAVLNVMSTVPPNSVTIPPTTTSLQPTFALLSRPAFCPTASSKATHYVHPCLVTPKVVTTPKVSVRGHNQFSGQQHHHSSSPALKPPPLPLPASSTTNAINTISPSSSLSSVGLAQNISVTSIASPTPAASASPTPAAVPVQQSQTQGSDTLQSNQHAGVRHKDKSSEKSAKEAFPKTNSRPPPMPTLSQSKRPNANVVNSKSSESCKSTVVSQNGLKTSSQFQPSPSANRANHDKNCATPAASTTNATTNTFRPDLTSPASLDSSTSSTHSSPELNGTGQSSALSPTAGNGATCPLRKPVKQKKIADIANTLHKRMSETLLSQVGNRSSSPGGRRPGQSSSPGLKTFHGQSGTTDHHDTAVAGLGRHEQVIKESLQNVPPKGLIRDKTGNAEGTPNSQTEEPLNLVKRDKEMVRLTNGMFILDIPPVIK